MKLKCKKRHCALLVSGWFFLALLASYAPLAYADERWAHSLAAEPKEKEFVQRSEQPTALNNTRELTRLVGPSGEEIHDFLYPVVEDGKAITPAN
jgi:hypothetical protein